MRGLCPPNLCIIESMMYGCRVAEVVDFLRTLDTPQQVCDALAGERDLVAGQLSSYLGALARRRAQHAPQPPPPQQWQPPLLARPPLPAQPWHPLEPQGPPPPPQGPLLPGAGGGEGTPHCCAALRERGSGG